MTDASSIQILVTPDFQGQLRKLAKRYRSSGLIYNRCSMTSKVVTVLAIKFLVRPTLSTKSGSKIAAFKKIKVQTMGSFINCETKSAFYSSRSIPNPMKDSHS
jgi:hypothetical protein